MKCHLKKLYLLLVPFICVFALFGLSKNANAVNVGTSGFSIEYTPNNNSAYQWRHNILYNQDTIMSLARYYSFSSPAFNHQGNYATIHFETNIVAYSGNNYYDFNFVNLGVMNNPYCTLGNGTTVESNYSTKVTDWTKDGGKARTLTVYGDVILKDVVGGSVSLYCSWGNPTYVFFATNNNMIRQVYFEKNVVSVIGSTNIDDALLNQQIAQNEVMIQNQQLMIWNAEQTNQKLDAMMDSHVSGNFNTSPIQPFGPIGTITNSILELPRVILNVNSCTPLTPELPYIHENIEIPCPSTILNGMAGGFITFLDTITSAGIWFILARYIFKKVQKLRDPENTDEEYLDI